MTEGLTEVGLFFIGEKSISSFEVRTFVGGGKSETKFAQLPQSLDVIETKLSKLDRNWID